jgi:PAS domain S-box-containing protein
MKILQIIPAQIGEKLTRAGQACARNSIRMRFSTSRSFALTLRPIVGMIGVLLSITSCQVVGPGEMQWRTFYEIHKAYLWVGSALLLVETVTLTTLLMNRARHRKRDAWRRLMRHSLEASSTAIFWIAPDGTFKYVNQAACHSLGYTQEELLARSMLDITPTWSPEIWEANWAWFKQEVPTTYRSLHRRKDGSTFPVEVLVNYLELDSHSGLDGQEYLFAFVTDVSDRQHADAERARLAARVHEQAQQMQNIMKTVPEGVLLLDAERRVVLANPEGQRYLSALSDADVGDVLTTLGRRTLAELLTAPSQGLWHEIQANTRTFQLAARAIETGTQHGGWVVVVRDVTQQREFEHHVQHQQRLAAVGQLAAGIAHDFNNIMAVIVLYSEIALRRSDLPSKLREHLRIINQQGQRASDLINQILDFSRSATLDLRPLDLVPLLKEQVKLWERTLPEHIRLDFAYDSDVYYIVKADPTRMQQMFMNLAVNARDAMPEGGTLRIDLERVRFRTDDVPTLPGLHSGSWLRIHVSDTGTGIPDEVLPHIFEPFFTTKAPDRGSGLGLAQVFGIVSQHNGAIDVETQMGEGTTFVIYLPALPSPDRSAPPVTIEGLVHGHGETILVVEDNASTRLALVDSLTQLNYHILEAANGQEGLELFERAGGGIALVLSDLVMPEMGGLTFTRLLRAHDPAARVVVLTGHMLGEEVDSLREAGVVAWLQKPPSLEQLSQVVAQALAEPRTGVAH